MEEFPLLRKLQLKGRKLSLLNLPEALEPLFPPEMERVGGMPEKAEAVLGFAENARGLEALIHQVLPGLDPDAVLWLAYPKKSSRRYSSDITRDSGWAPLAQYDYEPVSQVSLDEDWSALRFKPFANIKDPKRKGRMVRESGWFPA